MARRQGVVLICVGYKNVGGVGLKASQLERALRTTLTQDNREQLISYGKDLL